MKVPLFDFQQEALFDLRQRLTAARLLATAGVPQAISFSAPTGSGKTIVMAALFENIFFGTPDFAPQPDAVILWISDMPELNEQTRLKIEGKSDRIRVRQLVTIESDFDAEHLAGGHIYFINTQKLGTDKLLTRTGDTRQYTLWETLTNTAQALPDRFYVVIDEAHRGMQRTDRQVQAAQTILQKFLFGSEEDGLCRMPLVIGMTATPQRFERLLSGTPHTVHKVPVPSDDVRESGLLKERILIHFPDAGGQSEMTLLAEAAHRWQKMSESWTAYCRSEALAPVRPILVVQVEDGTESTLTRTDLPVALATLENALGRPLQEGEVAHAFHGRGEIEAGGHRVRYIEASRIEEDPKVNVVLFKMSLSTGWDCPRAEVMMSFRRAQDHTYIAQLLGRMVRTPLARRVEKDAALNDVHLYLPHYDEETVKTVINDLKNEEDVPPSKIGTERELVILQRRKGTEAIFEAMDNLETYRVNAVRSQSGLRRLMGLGRGLTHDRIDETAQTTATQTIVTWMGEEVQRLRNSAEFADLAKQITGVELKTIALKGTIVEEPQAAYAIDAALADIDSHFAQAGRRLGNGLHMAYWRANAERTAEDVKVEVIILSQDREAMQTLEQSAKDEFDHLYQQHKRKLAALREQRRNHYDRLRLATADPEAIPWRLPESIGFRRKPDDPQFDRHLYLEEDDTFHADLGTWEKGVLQEELLDTNVVTWLRNVDRQPWSLEIPYLDGGAYKSMFPDLLIVRRDADGFLFDILEPHDPSLADNAAKARGLAAFAEKHWHQFDRIQLIRKRTGPDGQEHYYRLDVGKDSVRRNVLAISDNAALDRLFEEFAAVRQM
ncbi:MAG: DEAD/DEAH box helicase [Anaerolineae bacterium]